VTPYSMFSQYLKEQEKKRERKLLVLLCCPKILVCKEMNALVCDRPPQNDIISAIITSQYHISR
jgi:hypothetical protein